MISDTPARSEGDRRAAWGTGGSDCRSRLRSSRHISKRYGSDRRDRHLQDAAYHLSFLANAVGTGCQSLFTDYVGWEKVLLTQLGIPAEDLAENLRCTQSAPKHLLPTELAEVASAYVDAGLQRLPQLPAELPTLMEHAAPIASLASEYLDALLRGDRQTASRLILGAVQLGRAGEGHLSARVPTHSARDRPPVANE